MKNSFAPLAQSDYKSVMTFRTKTVIALLATTLVVSACHHQPRKMEHGDYWQRKQAPSALYLKGPKAQHRLHKDIAGCTVEIRELQRLGSIREAIPPKAGERRSDGAKPGGRVAGFDSPDRDGANFISYHDYADFEGCMDHKGWERMKFVPHDAAEHAQDNWYKTIIAPTMRDSQSANYGDEYSSEADYSDLNQ